MLPGAHGAPTAKAQGEALPGPSSWTLSSKAQRPQSGQGT